MGIIILVWIAVLAASGITGYIAHHHFTKRKPSITLGYTFVSVASAIIVVGIVATVFLTNTESFKRFSKSMQSEFNGGITREIKVYSEGGDILFEDKGKFDVEHSNGRLRWVDEQGKVQLIYLGNSSTAIVNELDLGK